jgi:hypothetical protein
MATRRTKNPLDVPDRVYGANPRELASAVRRSAERTGIVSAPAQPAERAPRNNRTAPKRKLSGRVTDRESTQRKGGPGKRRPFPKKGAGTRFR